MDVSGEVTTKEVAQLVHRYCNEKLQRPTNLEVTSYKVKTIGDSPQGFLGKHYYLEILIRPRFDREGGEVQLKYFVKKAPIGIESFMKYIDEIQVFAKECRLFRQLIPRLQDMNSGFGKFAPDCHLIQPNIIIMDDLADQGFRMGSSRDLLLDYPHLLCAVKTLANMHSAAIILETKSNRTLTDMYPNCLNENSFTDDFGSIRNQSIEVGLAAICDLIALIPKYSASTKLSWIQDSYREKFRQMHVYCKPSESFRNVLLHGDLWSNNLMFRYDSSNSPIDCKVIDFQLSRYGPPVHDIMTILTTATTSAFRRKHMNALLENYYHFFDDFLNGHDMDIDDVITKMEFKECISYFRIVGLLINCHISHEVLMPSEVTKDVYGNSELFEEFICRDRSKLCVRAFETDSIYRDRMTDMITDLVDNYILKENYEWNY